MHPRRMLNRTSPFALSVAALIGAVASGCATSRPIAAADAPPPDFMLGVTILTPPGGGAGGDEAGAAQGEGLVPARHVMEADWVLRTLVGAGVTPETFPPRTRQLRRDQVQELWTLLLDSGLLDPAHPGRIGAWPADVPPPLRTMLVVEFTADGEHRVVAVEATGEGGEGARALAERLGELALVR